ncbi:P [Antarctic penguin virus A]|uniref:Phosphoprotein n=1 Tax=Antarctic penguin virus A TaxID=2006072 RepID=A0A1Y0KBV0_9MONO|nr:P [Antarctic penguin virus A] [Antarctic penguin virus A]ARU83007.1 P [Antarctic penguin virus A] [Antarctic penguin virus A]
MTRALLIKNYGQKIPYQGTHKAHRPTTAAPTMATFTDEEIDQLFDSSNSIIDSIITAQADPPQTVGKSAIPPGITKAKRDAWEKATASQSTSQVDNQPVPPDQQQHSRGQADNQQPHGTDAGSLANKPSQAFLSSIDKLANKQYDAGLKKGSTTLTPNQNPHLGTQGTHPTQPVMEPHTSDLATGGSSQSLGGLQGSQPPHGATPHAPLFYNSPLSPNAFAGAAQVSADFASEMRQMLETLMAKVTKMESTIEGISKQVAGIAHIRNDIQLVKVSVATMEGTLSLVKIMDPGNANVSSLAELRSSARSVPLITAGAGDPRTALLPDNSLALNKLGQPVKDPRDLITKVVPDPKDLLMEKETLAALINSRAMQPAASKRMLQRLEACNTMDEVKKLRKAILNS